ncbi:aminodeoxychorismate lyase [Romboutsia maritimum]|uniref:Aminodeoxychorismate lyase n=1 Tax=Romboutsia maritimum TaxID=2020948 RepID=A0A371IVZ6_9FIRM|nr:aminotransferase class IV [Romboutsia maritimum]RDY24638.1 aminodeoxychorismate lyase [Romboutsia maritimum]
MKSDVSFDSSLSKFGIGLFETIRVDKNILDLNLHIDRLYNSISELNLDISYDRKFIEDKIVEYVYKNKICNKALRLTVFDEGYNISVRNIPYDEKSYKSGFKLNISPIKRGYSILYRHKTTNYFENIYTKNYASKQGFNDGIFIDINGVVLECSMSNIFFIKNNTIFTPHQELPILNGTMKKRILDICGELNIKLIQKKIQIFEIKDFDFVFVTNSLMRVMKVTQIETKKYDDSNEIFDKILTCI